MSWGDSASRLGYKTIKVKKGSGDQTNFEPQPPKKARPCVNLFGYLGGNRLWLINKIK